MKKIIVTLVVCFIITQIKTMDYGTNNDFQNTELQKIKLNTSPQESNESLDCIDQKELMKALAFAFKKKKMIQNINNFSIDSNENTKQNGTSEKR